MIHSFPVRAAVSRPWFGIFLFASALAGCDAGSPPGSLSGTIRLGRNLPPAAWRNRSLLVVAERADAGEPLAVLRLVGPKFPYKYVLTEDDLVRRGTSFKGEVRVRARLDRDGEPGPFVKGDYRGRHPRTIEVGASGVDILIDEAGTEETPKAARKRPAQRQAFAPQMARARAPRKGEPGVISGTVSIAQGLARNAAGKPALFLIARKGRAGAPLAVLRVRNPRFPLPYRLTKENMMNQEKSFEGKVHLTVRMDSDGSAGPPQPGDLEGRSPGEVEVGSANVNIVVNKKY